MAAKRKDKAWQQKTRICFHAGSKNVKEAHLRPAKEKAAICQPLFQDIHERVW